MNKQEAIESIKKISDDLLEVKFVSLESVIDIVSQIHEPQKVVVPMFVAAWIEEMKQDKRTLYSVMSSLMNKTNHEWTAWKSANMNFSEIVAQAWIYGYEIEQEKLYTVEIPDPHGIYKTRYLFRISDGNIRIGGNDCREILLNAKTHLTKSEIKQDFEFLWKFAKEVE